MARLCTWLGGMLALIGCAAVPVSILSPRSLQSVPLIGGWLTGLSFGSSIIVVGLVMILLGQLMRALLEQANATRDLAAIARARAQHEFELGRRRPSD
jgi:hypothetical protein